MEIKKLKKLEFKTETIAYLCGQEQNNMFGASGYNCSAGDCTCAEHCGGSGEVGNSNDPFCRTQYPDATCPEGYCGGTGSCNDTCNGSCANCVTDGCTDPTPTIMMSKQLLCPQSYPMICP